MKTWQIYVVLLSCGWGLGAISVWVVGDLAVRAELKRRRAVPPPARPPSPWYLVDEENASAEQKKFMARFDKGGRR